VRGLWSQFGPNVLLTVAIVVGSVSAATVLALRQRRHGEPVLRPVARLLAWCSVAVIIAATLGFRGMDGGDGNWVLGLGDGGLRWGIEDLGIFPHTVQSILLVGNIILYVPLGLFGAFGTPDGRRGRVFLACAGVSLAIELLQANVLGGQGATDDVVLNLLGLTIGWVLGLAVIRFTGLREPEGAPG
jgi:hypothetical protein